ncbi:MAG: SGNH/GDSL hydrolase family protein [Sedimentisphaerales bacterium]|nr:SGNH/GDSL hydrolase family protein [Sedimentisphaerales bacterium]
MRKNHILAFLCFCVFHSLLFADAIWKNAADLIVGGKGWDRGIGVYRRLPDCAEGKVPASVWALSAHSAGLFIEFETDSDWIGLRWSLTSAELAMPHMPATGVNGIDVYGRDEKGFWSYVWNARPVAKENTFSITLPNPSSSMRMYRIYLPLYNGIEALEIGISDGKSFVQKQESRAKPIVYYGTSIAQGACASRPGMAFTAILQRRLDREVINLGFSGSGKMEPAMADFLAEIDASMFVIDCLWNLSGSDAELIAERVTAFAQTLRKAHPQTSIVFIEQSHFKGPFPTAASRAQRLGIVRLAKQGEENIHSVTGDELLGKDSDGTVDGCHPNDLGMARHADVLAPVLKRLLESQSSPKVPGNKG